MTNKFENISSEEIKLGPNGELELSDDLVDAISGGFTHEEEDSDETNYKCQVITNNCNGGVE